MTFEEFFIKKRIDLPALEKAEPSLFSEFNTHFNQMGEKSFDHTKKYWFNKLRRQYHLAPEIKPEKLHIPNPLAEQTIAESLGETVAAKHAPNMGFVPKFKASNLPKPAEEEKAFSTEETPAEKPVAKIGFVPRFKAAGAPAPGAEAEKKVEEPIVAKESKAETPEESSPAKPAYKPRFNIKNIPPKSGE